MIRRPTPPGTLLLMLDSALLHADMATWTLIYYTQFCHLQMKATFPEHTSKQPLHDLQPIGFTFWIKHQRITALEPHRKRPSQKYSSKTPGSQFLGSHFTTIKAIDQLYLSKTGKNEEIENSPQLEDDSNETPQAKGSQRSFRSS